MVYCLANNVVSPLGVTTEENYQAVKAGHSALTRYEGLWRLPEPFTAALFTDKQKQALAIDDLTTFESLAVASIRKAIAEVEIDITAPNVVFILGSTKGNVDLLKDNEKTPNEYYLGETASRIAQTVGITTHPIVACNACISGVSAIILAMRLLEGGFYDYAVVCGADVQNKFTVSGFQSLKAVSQDPCRPFDLERLGLNLGEAAATMILSRDRITCTSNSNAWCIESGAIRNDAFHVSSPSKTADGAYQAIMSAINGENPEELAFINAHGTATMFNDQMESIAIERAGLNSVPVNAYKGYYGHTMGAAGILETVLSMHAADNGVVLGTRGYQERGVSGKILMTSLHQPTAKSAFLKMISGFGGGNAAIFVSKDKEHIIDPVVNNNSEVQKLIVTHKVQISPLEVVVDGKTLLVSETGNNFLTSIYKKYVNDYPKFYKMDMLSRLGFLASELLLQAEGEERFIDCNNRAVILFNSSSSILSDKKYLESIDVKDNYYPSPSVFVYTLPNIVTGEIAMRNHYHGETSFYILTNKEEELINNVVRASFRDNATSSMITGWLDCINDQDYTINLVIIKRQK